LFLLLSADCLQGGDVYDAIVLAEKFRYTELSASRIMCHLLNAVEYLHHLNITHRNICLENILVSASSVRVLVVVTSGVARKSFRGGANPGGPGDRSPPVGSRGESLTTLL